MKHALQLKQLDIWWVDLEPTRGSETRKHRPCIVVQSDAANINSQTAIVAPLLPDHRPWLFAVNVNPSKANGLDKARYVNLKQMRSVDVSRFSKKQGVLEKRYLPDIHEAIKLVFDLDDE